MLKYDHFIFDFDGTLSDSYPAFVKAAKSIAGKYGVPSSDEQIYRLLKKHSTVYLFDTLGFGKYRDGAYSEFQRLLEELLSTEATAMEGAEDLLRFISENGGKSYVYSHSGNIVVQNVSRWGFKKYFVDYMLGDTLYPRKPAPDALLALMSKHGIEPHKCVMIGDRDIDILAGKNAKISGILIDDAEYYPELEVEYRVSKLSRIKYLLQSDPQI